MSELNVPALVGPMLTDLPCRKCAYNLRGLDGAGRCPECGTPVGYSVQGDLLRFSDPGWLRGLRVGIYLILASVALTIASVVLAILFLRAAGDESALVPLLTLVPQAIAFAGTWKLTESDPSGLGEQDYGRVRRFIRVALLIGVVGTLIELIGGRLSLADAAATALSVFSVLTGLLGLAGYCCQLVYLGRLARRLPDDALAGRARSLARTIGISYGIVLVVGFAMSLFGTAGGRTRLMMPLGCVTSIAALVLLVSFIRYLMLLERVGKRLKAEEAQSRVLWSAPAAAAGETHG